MDEKMMNYKVKSIGKRIVLLFLSMCLVISMCACGKSKAPSGKYYSEEFQGVYYEFDGESTCYLVIESNNTRVQYMYAVNEEDVGEIVDDNGQVHKTFIVHLSDTKSISAVKLVYDSYDDAIWDSDIGMFTK